MLAIFLVGIFFSLHFNVAKLLIFKKLCSKKMSLKTLQYPRTKEYVLILNAHCTVHTKLSLYFGKTVLQLMLCTLSKRDTRHTRTHRNHPIWRRNHVLAVGCLFTCPREGPVCICRCRVCSPCLPAPRYRHPSGTRQSIEHA